MPPHLLITRPLDRAEHTALKLSTMGFEPFVEPLLSLSPLPFTHVVFPAGLLQRATGFIATSATAVTAISDFPLRKDLPFFVCGRTTLNAAVSHGFSHPVYTGSTVASLIDYMITKVPSSDACLCYFSGDVVTTDVTLFLSDRHYEAHRIVVYQSLPTDHLSLSCITGLESRKFSGVLFYSLRTAEIFVELVMRAGLSRTFSTAHAFCISPKVEEVLRRSPLDFCGIHHAPSPESDSLLALVQDFRFIESQGS